MPLFRPLLVCILALALFAQGLVFRPLQADEPVSGATAVTVAVLAGSEPAGGASLQLWEATPVEAIGESLAVLPAVAPADAERLMEAPRTGPAGGKRSPYLDGIERPPRA